MSDIFSAMYDEIFLNENKSNQLDDEHINDIAQKYIDSKANVEDKKKFLRLKKEYFKIKSIDDYEQRQEKLYAKKNRKDIILFELLRISAKNKERDVEEQLSYVDKIVSLYEDDIPNDLYMKIVDGLINLELSLGIKIGLFKEFCVLFQEKCKNIEEEVLTDNRKYIKQK